MYYGFLVGEWHENHHPTLSSREVVSPGGNSTCLIGSFDC
jgi:hypothetical protein